MWARNWVFAQGRKLNWKPSWKLGRELGGKFGGAPEVGGEGGIRTPGRFNPSTVFKTAAFDHSATSPSRLLYKIVNSVHHIWNTFVHLSIRGLKFAAQKPTFQVGNADDINEKPMALICLLYTSPSPRDLSTSRMPSSA